VGFVRTQTGSFSASLLALAGFVFCAAILAALLKNETRSLQPATA
jgi:hypothetical protein